MALPLITVTGHFLRPDGSPAEGQVDFVLTHVLRDTVADDIYERVVIEGPLNANGVLSVDLVPTDHADVEPSGVMYLCIFRVLGVADHAFRFSLAADQNPIDLADITPDESTAGAVLAAKLFVQEAEPPATVTKGFWVQPWPVGAPTGVRLRYKTG